MNTKYYYNLYFSEGLLNDKAKIKRQIKVSEDIKTNQIEEQFYIVTLAQNKENNLEFLKITNLRQKAYNVSEIFVVGFAKDYNEAKELVVKIVNEVLVKTNGLDVRRYLLETQRKSLRPKKSTKKSKENRLSKVKRWISGMFFK